MRMVKVLASNFRHYHARRRASFDAWL